MVFPKKSLKLERLKKTRINKSDKSVHPNLQGFNPTPRIFEVYVFPPFGKAFKSSKQNLNTNFHIVSKKYQVSRNFLLTRLRAKEACCHEEELLQAFKKRLKSLLEVNLSLKPRQVEKLMLHTSVGKEHTSVSDWEIAV